MAQKLTQKHTVARSLKLEMASRKNKYGKYSLRDFAKSLDVSVSTLSLIMANISQPNLSTIKLIARELGWSEKEVQHFKKVRSQQKLKSCSKGIKRRVQTQNLSQKLSSPKPVKPGGKRSSDFQSRSIDLGIPCAHLRRFIAMFESFSKSVSVFDQLGVTGKHDRVNVVITLSQKASSDEFNERIAKTL